MDLNKLMQMGGQYEGEQELSLSMKEVIDNAGYLNDEQEEIFPELMGNAKNIVIDMALKTEAGR